MSALAGLVGNSPAGPASGSATAKTWTQNRKANRDAPHVALR